MPARLRRLRAAAREAAPALLGFAAVRVIGVAVLFSWGHRSGRPAAERMATLWDAQQYTEVAAAGYDHGLPSPGAGAHTGDAYSNLAFFPLYPALIRLVRAVTPLGFPSAALLIAWVASLAAAWGIFAVAAWCHGRRTGVLAAVVWGALPHAVVESLAYTEALFTALAAWSLYAVLTRRWLSAGALALLAGASRPNGIAVAAAVCCCAAAELWRRRRACGTREVLEARGASWRVWAGAALSPLGWLGYLAWVGCRRGSWRGYFAVQEEWGSRFDFGANGLRFVRYLLIHKASFAYFVALVILGVAVVLLALLVADRPPLALLVYTLVLVAITLGGSNYFASKPRFLLPAFPLLLPVALAMTRARPRTAVLTGGALAGFSFVYGTYLLTVARIAM